MAESTAIDIERDTRRVSADQIAPCTVCKRGLMHDNGLMFYQVTVSQCVADLNSIRRQHGLEMMLGNARIAGAMGDRTVARALPPTTHWLCNECVIEKQAMVLQLVAEG